MEEEVEKNPKEALFKNLADAIGETLEQEWGMSEKERRQLIEVLGLETKGGATGLTSSSSAKTHVATDPLLHDVQNRQGGDRSEGKYDLLCGFSLLVKHRLVCPPYPDCLRS